MKSFRNYDTMTSYKIRLRKIWKPNWEEEIFFH